MNGYNQIVQNGPVSVTRLNKFEGCPLAYYYKYEEKRPDPVGPPAEIGTLVHALIPEFLYSGLSPTVDSFNDVAVSAASGTMEFLSQEDNKIIAELWDKYTPQEYLTLRDMTLKGVQLANSVADRGEMILEQHFVKPLPCGVDLQGYIDFQCGEVLWDWKTGGNLKASLNSAQLSVYAWGLEIPRSERAYIHLRMNSPFVHDRFTPDQGVEWADNLCHQLALSYEMADAGEDGFPKKPGNACTYCAYKELCASETKTDKGIIIPEAVEDNEEALRLAQTILDMEVLLEEASNKLQAYCEINGTVELNGVYFGIYPGSQTKVWDTEGIYEMVKALPVEEMITAFNINARGVDALVKKYPHFGDIVPTLVQLKKGKSSFKHQKSAPKK